MTIRETCNACASDAGRGELGRSMRGKNISLEIRKAIPNQVATLTKIAFAAKRHWGYPEGWIQIWSPILTITSEFIKQYETYVAILDNELIGFCAISVKNDRASLEHMWVLPEYMGEGIGAEMFRYIFSKCKELGAQILEIESDPHAQGFYERMGAKKVREAVGEVDGQPRVLPLLEIKII